MNQLPDEPEQPAESSQKAGIRVLKTGLLIAGSALLGGLTVALWNRKSLARLRQPLPVPQSTPVHEDAEAE